MRGRDDSDVDLHGARRADRDHLVLLEHAKERGLRGGGEIADLVEEERPPFGGSNEPGLVARRAGERPLHVSEEEALDERRGERAAVHGDERAASPRLRVDLLREDLLPRAGGAEQEDGDRAAPRDPGERDVALFELGEERLEPEGLRGRRGVDVAHDRSLVRRGAAYLEVDAPRLEHVALP